MAIYGYKAGFSKAEKIVIPPKPNESAYSWDSTITANKTETARASGWYRFYVIGKGGNGGDGGTSSNNNAAGGGGGGASGAYAVHEVHLNAGAPYIIAMDDSKVQLTVNGEVVYAENGGKGNNGKSCPQDFACGAGSGGTAGSANGGNVMNLNGIAGTAGSGSSSSGGGGVGGKGGGYDSAQLQTTYKYWGSISKAGAGGTPIAKVVSDITANDRTLQKGKNATGATSTSTTILGAAGGGGGGAAYYDGTISGGTGGTGFTGGVVVEVVED